MDIPVYSVPSLVAYCIDVLIEQLSSHVDQPNGSGFQFPLYPTLSLPPEIGDAMIKRLNARHLLNEAWLSLFRSGSHNQMRRLCARRSKISNKGLSYLANQELQEIDVSENDHITEYVLYLFESKSASTLRHLNINHCTSINHFRCVVNFHALRSLDASYTKIDSNVLDVGRRLRHLKAINLSGLQLKSLKGLEVLADTLECLLLFDSLGTDFILKTVLRLKNLRKLDISCSPMNGYEHMRQYGYIEDELFHELTKLEALDLSGMQLCRKNFEVLLSVKPKLEFLGLMFVDYHNFPGLSQLAQYTTGEQDEHQIVLVLKLYKNRRQYVDSALRRLFEIARHSNLSNNDEALEAVCQCMLTYPDDYSIQSAGSASIYHFTKDSASPTQSIDLRRMAVSALLVAMEHHHSQSTRIQLQKNTCVSLCNFRIPIEVTFVYERLAKVLVGYMTNSLDDFVQRISLQLCNSLVCQVSGESKEYFGSLNFIELLLGIISARLQERSALDEEDLRRSTHAVHVAWSAMWNVTDETPENCERFLKNDGVDVFLQCFQFLHGDKTLIVNMLGLLGNVAEVKSLRFYLMREDCMRMFRSLLRESELEIGYNSAGILAHLASDGEDAWTVSETLREETLNEIVSDSIH
ncbi:uncharacterized protein TRIADDRAFT_53463 [Trichoplax adhaerens]|uniref:Uncharacterized protein n=1 Tax=Trichoplax adhaerens TaxID=10228 RepID=B3RPA4_TRIAD|nr:hypothetical protein TRIADDRAFT_53463 [Trichoplax adhaerens]EDV28155.1 hypothetical protein TRIADDRAFT_53463 [Trichoplax adhaerens]|eukprot:XP_002109989.1 hypothetical protein TRIADDRAFT_53463 [Trichoplax adhaerens]